MDANRFDALSQFVTRERNRRGVVRALLGIAAGSGLTPLLAERADARKKRKKRKKQRQPCAPCQRRIKGRCTGIQPNGAPCGECGGCFDGVCQAGKIACGSCQECDATGRCRPCGPCRVCDAVGRCLTAPDNAACGTNGKCLERTCNEPPTCTGGDLECGEPETPACCSGRCRAVGEIGRFCALGARGTPCFINNDCLGTLTCIGYRCG
ncbi:MAG: hypothetical protein ACRDJC_09725 [Thermomicrobiales bacterium]